MTRFQNQSTLLSNTEVKASDLGGCKTSDDFAKFAKARHASYVNDRHDPVIVENGGKVLMFSNSKKPFSPEYRKLLMRAFIAMGFLKFIILLGVILAVIGLLHFTGIV
jgi:hypothetical protein